MSQHSITLPTLTKVRATFVQRGTTLTAWARSQGFNQVYVWDLCKRYGGRAAQPKGLVACRILQRLNKDLPELAS